MSYIDRKTLEDFEEAWRYGAKLNKIELERFDKIIKKLIEYKMDINVINRIKEIRESYNE